MNIKKMVAIILSVILAISASVSSLAYTANQPEKLSTANSLIQPRYIYIDSYTTTISSSGNTITGSVSVQADSSVNVYVEMYLERKSGSTWVQLGDILGSGTFSGGTTKGISRSRSVTSGGEYRVHSIIKILINNKIVETAERYSNTITI